MGARDVSRTWLAETTREEAALGREEGISSGPLCTLRTPYDGRSKVLVLSASLVCARGVWLMALLVMIFVAVMSVSSGSWDAGILRQDFVRKEVARSLGKLNMRAFFECLEREPKGQINISPALIMAFVAAENHGRPALVRWIKLQYADIYRWINGRIPDISLGIAQLRPSTLEMLLAQGRIATPLMKQVEQLTALRDFCQSIHLSIMYMQFIIDDLDLAVDNRADFTQLAKIYNGQRTETAQNILYLHVLWESFIVLRACLDNPDNSEQTFSRISWCIHGGTHPKR
jgi:hypothetical protein